MQKYKKKPTYNLFFTFCDAVGGMVVGQYATSWASSQSRRLLAEAAYHKAVADG